MAGVNRQVAADVTIGLEVGPRDREKEIERERSDVLTRVIGLDFLMSP